MPCDIATIDPEIYGYYTSIDENRCITILKCGCPCPNVCGKNGYCFEHIHATDFAAATTHTHFTNTTQKLVIKPKNTDYSIIHAMFGAIPPEILINIVRYFRFPDLKKLYAMRIPAVLSLVQGDLLFNHEALYASSVLSCVFIRKFDSEYTRGLRAIDRAISMTRMLKGTYDGESCFKLDVTRDLRHFNYDKAWKKRSNDTTYSREIRELKMRPYRANSADVFHNIGLRRCLPGVVTFQKEFQYIREFIYDDFFARNPIETARITKHFNENRQHFNSMVDGPFA
jgi:hypothetical protein